MSSAWNSRWAFHWIQLSVGDRRMRWMMRRLESDTYPIHSGMSRVFYFAQHRVLCTMYSLGLILVHVICNRDWHCPMVIGFAVISSLLCEPAWWSAIGPTKTLNLKHVMDICLFNHIINLIGCAGLLFLQGCQCDFSLVFNKNWEQENSNYKSASGELNQIVPGTDLWSEAF